MTRRLLAALFLSLAVGCDAGDPAPAPSPPAAPDTAAAASPVRDTVLEATLRELAAGVDGRVGVAVLHVQGDVYAAVNGDTTFALASVAKLPVAYAALQDGRLSPSDSLQVTADDLAPGPTSFVPGAAATVADLVERSLAHSDNTASDVLLRAAGGPAEVTRRVRDLGAGDLRVDRSMRRIFADRGAQGEAVFLEDPRDTGSAEAVAALLAAVLRGESLEPEAQRLMLDALASTVTGPDRTRAGVPAGTAVAHKTGTLGLLTHDVGIITLPGGAEVVLAVLLQSEAPIAQRERVIAGAARAVWEHFSHTPASSTTVPPSSATPARPAPGVIPEPAT